MPHVTPENLLQFSCALFVKAGLSEESALVVARSLVEANLAGHDSHGVMRIPQYVQFLEEGKYRAEAPFEILQENAVLLAADGNWGLGQVQAHRLLDYLIRKASQMGIAAGTLRRVGHTGRLGEYAEVANAQQFVFFGTVNSHGAGQRVVPPGGKEGRLSTNPLCMGVPTETDPVIIDFGTSAVAEGKVRGYYQNQKPTPEGWLVDAQGEPTSDPAVLYEDPRGGILPFGGAQMYKGFGLGLMLDFWAGGLSGGKCSDPAEPRAGVGNSVFFMVLNPAFLGGTDHFLAEVSRLKNFVRSTPTRDGASIVLPNDPEIGCRLQRNEQGISIPEGTWKLIADLAARLEVVIP